MYPEPGRTGTALQPLVFETNASTAPIAIGATIRGIIYIKTEKPVNNVYRLFLFFSSTQSRGRTGTALQPLVFETNASTDSAIWALGEQRWISSFVQNRVANVFKLSLIRNKYFSR